MEDPHGQKKATRKSLSKLRAETDRLARQAKRTKEQLDKVQHAADTLVEKTAPPQNGKSTVEPSPISDGFAEAFPSQWRFRFHTLHARVRPSRGTRILRVNGAFP
jgi:hypothetical protein